MYTHTTLGSNDLEVSKKFYDAALIPLGIKSEGNHGIGYLYSSDAGVFIVLAPIDGEAACPANGGTIGFAAPNKEAVDAFHAGGMANGGSDEGAPGKRPNAPGNAYGAYIRDPFGNKLCAFCQLPEGE